MGRFLQSGERVATSQIEPEVANDLRACEAKIEAALGDAWHALRKIHDDKLYKADKYGTFEDYCEKRWGYSKSHAYRLIDHAKLVDHLKAEGVTFLPSGEGLTRPIQKMRRSSRSEEEFLQRAGEAWQIAQDTAPKVHDVPQVTVQHVESTMQHFGLYRSPQKKNTDSAAVAELRTLLTKVGQSDALKIPAEKFVETHGAKAFPSEFLTIVDWLVAAAGVADFGDGT